MHTNRIEAFSDGVVAILITIMVLELRHPVTAELSGLRPLLPVFLTYVLSFIFLGIYWNNHHHLFQAAEHVNGRVLWANLHLLFWLSLIPFVTSWMGSEFEAIPVASYGVILLMAAFAYRLIVLALLAIHSVDSRLTVAIGDDRKGILSLVLYALAIPLSFVNVWIACALYVIVAIIWVVPDMRIEKTLAH